MKRTRLRNQFLKNRTNKIKNRYTTEMNHFFQTKWYIRKKKLIEENETVSNYEDTTQVLNTFFPNILDSLNIHDYVTNDPISTNISILLLKRS